jgi:hypothetical protein
MQVNVLRKFILSRMSWDDIAFPNQILVKSLLILIAEKVCKSP